MGRGTGEPRKEFIETKPVEVPNRGVNLNRGKKKKKKKTLLT